MAELPFCFLFMCRICFSGTVRIGYFFDFIKYFQSILYLAQEILDFGIAFLTGNMRGLMLRKESCLSTTYEIIEGGIELGNLRRPFLILPYDSSHQLTVIDEKIYYDPTIIYCTER